MLNKKRKMHACEMPDTIKGKVIILKKGSSYLCLVYRMAILPFMLLL